MDTDKYLKEQIEFCNKQLLELCIKIGNSKLSEEYEMLCELQRKYKELISYYRSQ